MDKSIQETAKKYIKNSGRRRRWRKVVIAMAAVVVFCTTYALIMPAVTLQGQVYCGLEEHTEHTDECFAQTRQLSCGLTEEGHVHSDACYEERDVIICGQEETDGHVHGDGCFATEEFLICNNEDPEHVHESSCYESRENLICTEQEHEPHHHDENCIGKERVCVCGLDEQPPHRHSDECYTVSVDRDQLICGHEIHEHSLQCFSNPQADLETPDVWEQSIAGLELTGDLSEDVVAVAKSQLGYTESSRNYLVMDDGETVNGYTRYGAWYGDPYGNWCAMFCSFCLHYAGVEDFPLESGCQRWIDVLREDSVDLYRPAGTYAPAPGDLIFFDTDLDPDSDHVGIVAEVTEDNGVPTEIRTIEGNCAEQVRYMTYSINDASIMGYGELPKNELLAAPMSLMSMNALGATYAAPSQLRTSAANSWQIVAGGYNGNDRPSYRVSSVDADHDGKIDAWVQKNVVPTDKENEFYVYLSISKPLTFEDLFRTCNIGIANNNNGAGFGGFSSGTPGGYKGKVYGEVPEGTPHAVYAQIDIYERTELVGSGNNAHWEGRGALLGSFIGWRDCPGNVECSNGSIYLEFPINGVTNYLKLANQTTLKTSDMTGQGNPFHPIISYESLHNAGVDFSLKNTSLDRVTDILGENIEYLGWQYCDGSLEEHEDEEGNVVSFEWTPVEKEGYKTITTNPLSGTYDNVAELVYKVRLKTEVDGFNSCAEYVENGRANSTTDPEAYEVNQSATLDYSIKSLSGVNPPSYYNGPETTVNFQKPYVRGLLYDVWFKKVDENFNPLEGAEFKLLDKNRQVLKDEDGNDRVYTSDENGFVGLFDLPGGEYTGIYYLLESGAPVFYKIPAESPWYIPLDYTSYPNGFTSDSLQRRPENMRVRDFHNPDGPWQIVNLRADGQPVKFVKIDSTSEQPVRGAVFALYGADENGTMNDSPFLGYYFLRSDENGIFSPDNMQLPPGTYYLKETQPQNGYVPLDYPVRIDVREDTMTASMNGELVSCTLEAGCYVITVENDRRDPTEPVPPPDIPYPEDQSDVALSKQIKSLDPDADLYRLYLTLEEEQTPIDMLIVIDQSNSMNWGMENEVVSTDSRQAELLSFLNGTGGNGFISKFLNANQENELAVMTFGSDASGAGRYVRAWGRDATDLTLPEPEGATNYTAALNRANEILAVSPDNGHIKMMVFLSDGVPTIAYKDGAMQSTFAQNNLAGDGSNGVSSFLSMFSSYLSRRSIALQFPASLPDPLMWLGLPRTDDLGNRIYVPWAQDEFPHGYDMSTAVINVPGISQFPYGEVTDEAAFTAFYSQWRGKTVEEQNQWLDANMIYPGDEYNLYWLSETSFAQFSAANPNVLVYTIGFSSSAYDSAEVLCYFAGPGRYFHCMSDDELMETFSAISGLSGVEIHDSLSDYARLAADPQLVITMTHAGTETVLYENGRYTTLAGSFLDTSAAPLSDDGTLAVKFRPDVLLGDDFRCVASFNIRPTMAAYEEYAENGYNAVGDQNTDVPGNTTSSGQRGFYCNDEASASWTISGKDDTDVYDKPVIQLHTVKLTVTKQVSGATTDTAFTFEACAEDGAILPPAADSGYTVDDEGIAHFQLAHGDSVEIILPPGLNVTIRETEHAGFTQKITKGDVPISSTDSCELVIATDTELTFVNTPGYELPHTGGIGTTIFYVVGGALALGALVLLITKRRMGR